MTLEEFEEYIQTEDGESHYYEWLYDNFPELGKHGLFSAMENGYCIESFMEEIGVEDDPATTANPCARGNT